MTDKYLYAIIDALGACWVILDGRTEKVEGLPWLMRQGWNPIRETPYMSSLYILICLERDNSPPTPRPLPPARGRD